MCNGPRRNVSQQLFAVLGMAVCNSTSDRLGCVMMMWITPRVLNEPEGNCRPWFLSTGNADAAVMERRSLRSCPRRNGPEVIPFFLRSAVMYGTPRYVEQDFLTLQVHCRTKNAIIPFLLCVMLNYSQYFELLNLILWGNYYHNKSHY